MTRSAALLLIAASAALLAAAGGEAQTRVHGPRADPPPPASHFGWDGRPGFRGGFGGTVWIVERRVPVYIERQAASPPPPAPAPAAPPPAADKPRKPFKIGASYAALPGGCMKMIADGSSYYWCSGEEWYRQVGKQYQAVERP